MAKKKKAVKKVETKQIDSVLIRVSKAVLSEIARQTEHYRETPDSVLRRVFKLPKREHWRQKESD